MKKKKGIAKLHIDSWGRRDGLLVVNMPEEEIQKWLKKHWTDFDIPKWVGPEPGTCTGAKTTTFVNGCFVVWIPDADLGVLGHELCHVVVTLFDALGHPVTAPGEDFAYLWQYLFEESVKALKEM